jgi:hypothetical protein
MPQLFPGSKRCSAASTPEETGARALAATAVLRGAGVSLELLTNLRSPRSVASRNRI